MVEIIMNASNNTNLPLGMGYSFLITIEQFDIDSIINNIFTTEISSKAFASGLFKGTMREYPSSDITPTKLFMLKSYGIASRKSIPMKPNIDSHICTIIVDAKFVSDKGAAASGRRECWRAQAR